LQIAAVGGAPPEVDLDLCEGVNLASGDVDE
jgi:hypothetical protein